MATKTGVPKMKRGRPSKYSKYVCDKICELISTTSNGLVTICKSDDMPSIRTVLNWLNDPLNEEFVRNYTRARELQADVLADEIISLSDSERRTTTINSGGEFGGNKSESDNPQRTRLQIDARKWKASKLAPKKYGDRLDVTTKGEAFTNKYDLSKLTTDELLKLNDINTKLGNTGGAL